MLQHPATPVQPSNRSFSRLSIRNHMGTRSIAVKMFIIRIFDSVLP